MKRQTKRCLAVLLALLTLFSCLSVGVSALTVGDTVRVSGSKEWISGFYYDFSGSGLGTNKYGQHQYLHTEDGRPAYCIEPNEHFTDGTKTIRDSVDSLSEDVQDKISFAELYGYDGKSTKYGYSWETEYVATWGIVWSLVLGHFDGAQEEAYLNHVFGGRTSAENRANAKAVYAKIKEQILSHKVIPSFTVDRSTLAQAKKITLKYNVSTGKYEGSVTDTKGVLSGYTFAANGVTFSKSGNTLHISTNQILKDCTVTGERISNTYVSSLPALCAGYAVGNDQTTTFAIDLKDPVNAYFSLETESVGNIRIVKQSEDGVIADVPLHISGNGVEKDVRTGSDGTITAENLIAGTYTVTELVGDKYIPQSAQTVTVLPGQTASVYFSNILKKFTVTVKKQDSVTGTAQGDATLENAVYGIYDGDTLIDTYTTDKSGAFTSREYICGEDWTLRELTPSQGYLLDETVYRIGAEPRNFTIEHNPISMTVTENPILGQIAIIKHNDNGDTQIETPEVGAAFEVYLKSVGSYASAKDRERDLLVTDENGFAQTKKLPYGVYTVHQTQGNEGAAFIPDFEVVISEHNEVYRYIINNATFESYLKFTKTDAETGKTIPLAGTGVQLYDPQGNLVTMSFTYPTPTVVDTFYTDSEGKLVTPQKLPYGKGYKAVEVKAPYGYVLDSTPVYFDITPETMQEDDGLTVVLISKSDAPQKGTIDITKLGEVFSSVSEENGIYQPVFDLTNNKDAEFRITAAENIVTPDGTLRTAAGTVADTLVIGDSTTKSKPLYLGKYFVQETKAAHGMVLDPTVYEVTIAYAGQNVSVTSAAITVTNARQKAIIDLEKVLEKDEVFDIGEDDEILNVQFALYATEELTAADGSVIPKDGLLEILSLNENGTAQFSTDLPVDAKTYVKEYSTDEHYILSDEIYPVVFEYEGQDTAEVHISVNNGVPIDNTLKRGDIYGKKVDEQGNVLAGCQFGLFPTSAEDFTEEAALMLSVSDENGVFTFIDVPMGDYMLVELSAPDGYLFDSTPIAVSITEDGQLVELEAVNTWADGKLIIMKSDISNGKPLPNVGFRIRNELGEIIREGYTDESGVVEFDKLQKGKYTYQEFAAADGYILDETEYPFGITDEQTVVRINMTNTPLPVEIPKTGETAAVWLTVTATAVLLSAAWITLSQKKRKSKV